LANIGDKIYYKGNGDLTQDLSNKYIFVMAGLIKASGSVMSLLDGIGSSTTISRDYTFGQLFYVCMSLTSAPSLPATILSTECYKSMFFGCTSLITAPALPAITLANSCYEGMFTGCTSLICPPKLPAITLAENCYGSMFYSCTSVIVSDTSGVGYTNAWHVPTSGTFTNTYAQRYMFLNCLGSRSSDHMAGKAGESYTYYTQNAPV